MDKNPIADCKTQSEKVSALGCHVDISGVLHRDTY